jgi:hypothetical protein
VKEVIVIEMNVDRVMTPLNHCSHKADRNSGDDPKRIFIAPNPPRMCLRKQNHHHGKGVVINDIAEV